MGAYVRSTERKVRLSLQIQIVTDNRAQAARIKRRLEIKTTVKYQRKVKTLFETVKRNVKINKNRVE